MKEATYPAGQGFTCIFTFTLLHVGGHLSMYPPPPHTHTHTHACMHACMHACLFACACMDETTLEQNVGSHLCFFSGKISSCSLHVWMCGCVDACVRVCVYKCACMHAYRHASLQWTRFMVIGPSSQVCASMYTCMRCEHMHTHVCVSHAHTRVHVCVFCPLRTQW